MRGLVFYLRRTGFKSWSNINNIIFGREGTFCTHHPYPKRTKNRKSNKFPYSIEWVGLIFSIFKIKMKLYIVFRLQFMSNEYFQVLSDRCPGVVSVSFEKLRSLRNSFENPRPTTLFPVTGECLSLLRSQADGPMDRRTGGHAQTHSEFEID